MLFRVQAGVIGTRFTLLPKTTEKIFKRTLDTRKWRTVIPKGPETSEESNQLSELIASREFLSHDAGRGTQVEPRGLPEFSWCCWDSRETTGARSSQDANRRGESCTQTELQRPTEVPLRTQQISDELLPIQKLPKAEKGIVQKDYREQCLAVVQSQE